MTNTNNSQQALDARISSAVEMIATVQDLALMGRALEATVLFTSTGMQLDTAIALINSLTEDRS